MHTLICRERKYFTSQTTVEKLEANMSRNVRVGFEATVVKTWHNYSGLSLIRPVLLYKKKGVL